MGIKFDLLTYVKLQSESYRLRVRVVRKWFVPGFINPQQPMSKELILMDEKGHKIQATARKYVLYKFSDVIKEGVVYYMSYFGVVANTGAYRATSHENKLIFLLRTTVAEVDFTSIPFYGLTPTPSQAISSMTSDHD